MPKIDKATQIEKKYLTKELDKLENSTIAKIQERMRERRVAISTAIKNKYSIPKLVDEIKDLKKKIEVLGEKLGDMGFDSGGDEISFYGSANNNVIASEYKEACNAVEVERENKLDDVRYRISQAKTGIMILTTKEEVVKSYKSVVDYIAESENVFAENIII